ncbi:hypothetical protein Purlil1_12074 [Purpureocillium lilacinum]|uniref:IBR domain-containing protein n=1 Tax=Purpureocillium lilacinum TaxID=33203 RepID=A0ABR0BIC5_PURLI|nr:hypothetical protein Purlil1_12074 [Purpureocillium lilacinum]
MDRNDRAAVYGYRARLPRHRLGLRSRVLVDLTCRHSSQPTEIIDLTGDETGYRQPQQASHLDAVVKMASDIDTSATNEAQANPVGLYCAACNGTIGAQPVLRICGCLYCKACNANAARRWNGQDFACNIYQHWRQGNHAGRETFGLDEECSICFEALATGQIQCLPCGQLRRLLALDGLLIRAPAWQGHDMDSRWAQSPVRAQGHGTERTGGLVAEDAEGVDTREWAGTTHAECLMRMARSGRFRAKSSGDIYIRSQCPDEDDGRKCNSTAPRATRQPLSTFDFRLRSVRLFSYLNAMEAFVASMVLVRCLRCGKTQEMTSTDDVHLHGYVRIGYNLTYCTNCAEETGHPGVVQVN